jgi:hypothetical protein
MKSLVTFWRVKDIMAGQGGFARKWSDERRDFTLMSVRIETEAEVTVQLQPEKDVMMILILQVLNHVGLLDVAVLIALLGHRHQWHEMGILGHSQEIVHIQGRLDDRQVLEDQIRIYKNLHHHLWINLLLHLDLFNKESTQPFLHSLTTIMLPLLHQTFVDNGPLLRLLCISTNRPHGQSHLHHLGIHLLQSTINKEGIPQATILRLLPNQISTHTTTLRATTLLDPN